MAVLLQQVACQTWEMIYVQQLPLVCGGKGMSVRLLLQHGSGTVGGSNVQGVPYSTVLSPAQIKTGGGSCKLTFSRWRPLAPFLPATRMQ